MAWLLFIFGLAYAGYLVYAVSVFRRQGMRTLLAGMNDIRLRRRGIDLIVSSLLVVVLGFFFLLGQGDAAFGLKAKNVPRPGRPLPPVLSDIVHERETWDPTDIKLGDLDRPCQVRFFVNANRRKLGIAGPVGRFSSQGGYWRLESAAIEIGDARHPIVVTTPEKSSWPETIREPFTDDQLIVPEVTGEVDLSKAPRGKSLACRVILRIVHPQYAAGKRYGEAAAALQMPFSLVVPTEQEWNLACAWKDYERYQDILSTRRDMRWLCWILGPLTLAAGWWFHASARAWRAQGDEAAPN